MGRPKGSKNKIIKLDFNNIETREEPKVKEEVKEVKKKTEKEIPHTQCDLCNGNIYSTPYNIRLSSLTAKATWHRNCSVESLNLCKKCSEELNTLIDDFIIKKNKNLKKRNLD